MTLLLVEDDENIALTLGEHLELNAYHVRIAPTLQSARKFIQTEAIHLVVLDVNLPDGSGFDLAEEIRDFLPEVPIIFLTAMGTPDERIQGLELGAIDYVVKPFHLKELLLRIRNALSRGSFSGLENTTHRIRIGDVLFDWDAFTLSTPQNVTTLSQKECEVLKLLVQHAGEVVSRDAILDHVWEEQADPSHRTVDNIIVKLRKALEPHPRAPQVILNVRGVGYKLIL